MAFDGIVLSRITADLKEILPARIMKINNISDTELLFQLKSAGGKYALLLSCHSQFNRINLTGKQYPVPSEPSNFVMLLRKYLENGMITEIKQGGLDRYLSFCIAGHDELGEKTVHYLFAELMGKYANAILCDKNLKIMDALKRIPPFENNKRTIQPGAMFTYPEEQGKKDPFTAEGYDAERSFTEQFSGFSPLLSKEVTYRLHNGESFTEIMKEIAQSKQLYVQEVNGQVYFHVLPLKHLDDNYRTFGIQEGLDELYFYKEERDRIRQQTGDLFKFVRHELKKNQQKKAKLEDSLKEALDCDKWRIYGDLLYAYPHMVPKGATKVALADFEGTGTVIVPLEAKLNASQNAKKCFQRYNKGKKGQIHIQHQIELCEAEIEYFSGLSAQLALMDFADAQEVREELIQYGYLSEKRKQGRRKKKDIPLHFLSIALDEDTTIYVGKNNRQNEFLTFQKARKDDWWFHAQGYHGSHTVVHAKELNEDIIRLAAMFAAYYSEARQSESIPVSYTQVKNLKKIPQAKAGMVSMGSYKTIYIDIDKEQLRKYVTLQEVV